jgi:SAM-dependent methyltransferase
MSASFECLICHGDDSELVYQDCPDYYLGTPFKADYVRCRACGLLQQSPIPPDVSAFYHAYPVHAPKSRLYAALRWLVMSSIYYDARRHPAGTAILDYGCGDGGYLETLGGRGFRLHGYEKDPAQAARVAERLGLPVHADIEALVASMSETFDVVTFHKVLEHLTDPDEALAAARHLLKPGGLLYLVVPHADSIEARLFGRKWHSLDPPRHISLPAVAHVRRLADRHGYALSRHAPIPFPNGFAASVPVVLSGRFRFALFALAFPLGVVWSRLVPTGSHAYWLSRQ